MINVVRKVMFAWDMSASIYSSEIKVCVRSAGVTLSGWRRKYMRLEGFGGETQIFHIVSFIVNSDGPNTQAADFGKLTILFL